MAPKHKVKLPKGVWFQPKRLKITGEVVRYGYLGRGVGVVALGRYDAPEFFANLAAAMQKEPAGNTVDNLIVQYKRSPEFLGLKERTKADYLKELDRISSKFGNLSLRAMSAREIAPHIYQFRDERAATPRSADYTIQVLKALLSWGVRRGHLEQNRAGGIERVYRSNRREISWSEHQVSQFLKAAPEPMKRAMILALESGQRQADLLALPWSAVKDGMIRLRQNKTGVQVAVPISPALETCLRGVEKTAMTVLTKADGEPWDPKGNGFRAAWAEVCEKAQISGVTFHDLRGTFVTRRLAEGWTTEEVASCTGHSLRDLASLDSYADRAVISEATAKRLAKRMREPKT